MPTSGPIRSHVAPPSPDCQTPTSEPTYRVRGVDESRMMAFSGRSSGGLMLVHDTAPARAFVVLNTCPPRPGVAASKLPKATYSAFASPGSNARLLTVRPGRLPVDARSVQLLPPFVVNQTFPLTVPKA